MPLVEANYENFSATDKVIADFFIHNKKLQDFSASKLSEQLFVSKSALSRFAKRIGFKGYREFISFYTEEVRDNIDEKFTSLTQKVLYTYQEILEKSYSLINEKQIQDVVEMISTAEKVYIYGIGNSGLCAMEFKMRFMRLGLNVEAITDIHIMNMNDILFKKNDVLIALSISAYPLEEHVISAKEHGTKVIFLTANNLPYVQKYSDKVIICPSTKNLDVGNVISPQMPLLLILDVIYAFYLSKDSDTKQMTLIDTLRYIRERNAQSL